MSSHFYLIVVFVLSAQAENGDTQGHPHPSPQSTAESPVTIDSVSKVQNKTGHGGAVATARTEKSHMQNVAVRGTDYFHMQYKMHNALKEKSAEDALAASSTRGIVKKNESDLLMPATFNTSTVKSPTEQNLTSISNYEEAIFSFTEAGFESLTNDTLPPVAHLSTGVEEEKSSVLLLHAPVDNRNQRVSESITLMSTHQRLGFPIVTAPLLHTTDNHADSNDEEEKRGQQNGISELERKIYPLNQTESILGDRKDVSVTTEPMMRNTCLTCLQEKRLSSTEEIAVLSALFIPDSSLSLRENEQGKMLVVNSSHQASVQSSTTAKNDDRKTDLFDDAKTSKRSTFNFSVNILDRPDFYFMPPFSLLESKINLSKTILNESLSGTFFSKSRMIVAKTNRTELLTMKVENKTRLSDQIKDIQQLSSSVPYPSTASFQTLLVKSGDKNEKISGKIVNLGNQSTVINVTEGKTIYTQIKLNVSVNPQNTSHIPQSSPQNHILPGVEMTNKDITKFNFEDEGKEEREHAVGEIITIPLSAPFATVPPLSGQNSANSNVNDINTGSIVLGMQDSLNSLFNQAHEIIKSRSHTTDYTDKSPLAMRMPSMESRSSATSFDSARRTTPAVKVPPASQTVTKNVRSLMSVLSTAGYLPAQPSVLLKEQQSMSVLPEVYRTLHASVTMTTLSKKMETKIADRAVLPQTAKSSAELNAPWPTKLNRGKTSTSLTSDTTSKLHINVPAMITTTIIPQKSATERQTEKRHSVGRGDIKSSGNTTGILSDGTGNLKTVTSPHRYQTAVDSRELQTQHFLKLKNKKEHVSDSSLPQDPPGQVTEVTNEESSSVQYIIPKTTERLTRDEQHTNENKMSFSNLLIKHLGATARNEYNQHENLSESLEGENRSFSSQVLSQKMPVQTLTTASQILSQIISFDKKTHIGSKAQTFSTHRAMLTKYANTPTVEKQINQQRDTTIGKQVFPMAFLQSRFSDHQTKIRDVNVTIYDMPTSHVSPVNVKTQFSTPNSVRYLNSLTTAKSPITIGKSTVQPHFALKTSFSTSVIQQVSEQKHYIRTLTSTTSGSSVSRSMTVGRRVQHAQPSTQLFDITRDILTSDIAKALNVSRLVRPTPPRLYNDSVTSPSSNDYLHKLALHLHGQSSTEIMPFFDSPAEGLLESFTDSEEKEEWHSNASHASPGNKQISPSEASLVREVKSEQSGFSTRPAPFAADISAGTSSDSLNQSEPDETIALRTREIFLPNASLQQTTNMIRNKHRLSGASPEHKFGRKLLRSGNKTRSLALHERMGLSSPDLLTGLAVISDDICGTGNYTAEMNLNLEHDLLPGDFVSALGILHVVINLKTNNSQVNLDIKSCCLSPTGQLEELNTTCSVFSRLPLDPQGIRLLPSVLSKRASFTIGLFQMINYSTAYLHCHLSVCLRNHTACERQCLQHSDLFSEQAPEAIATNLRNRISFGPMLKREENSSLPEEMDTAAEMETVLVVLGMVVGCSLVAGTLLLLWTAYRRRRADWLVYPESTKCCGCLHRGDLVIP